MTSCDPALAARFTPRRPLLGRYEVCTDPRPAGGRRAGGLGGRGARPGRCLRRRRILRPHRATRLYRGARAGVSRGWTVAADRFESLTFISPHPNAALTALEPGTLVIRWICDSAGGVQDAECRMKSRPGRFALSRLVTPGQSMIGWS